MLLCQLRCSQSKTMRLMCQVATQKSRLGLRPGLCMRVHLG